MQNKDILSTLQKHVGVLEDMPTYSKPYSSIHIHKFGEDMKGANEFIGALQSAHIALKKLLRLAQSVDSQSENIQIAQTKSAMQDVITNASFMGLPLFDSNLNATLNATNYSVIIDNPMPLLIDSQDSIHNFITYIEDKTLELNQILLAFSEALSEPIAPKDSNYEFKEYSPKHFAHIFKES